MGYSKEVVARARRQLEEQRSIREAVQRQRLEEAYEKLPRLQQIDIQLRRSMSRAAQAVFSGEGAELMEKVKQENLALQKERKELVAANFAPDYLEEKPLCSHCGGSGYIGSTMCRCLAELCRREQKKEIARLTNGAERFESFRLDYYPDRHDPQLGVNPRTVMERNLKLCKEYVENFCPQIGSLYFLGGTGLGKTFLAACIANALTDKGFSVCYEPAARLFGMLEKNRFNPDEESAAAVERYMDCDLLIVDDLGTEMPGSFVTAALYTLLNDRLLSDKPMLITSNQTEADLMKRYTPQIVSRIKGCFKRLIFVGEDIRVMKNRGVSNESWNSF